MTERLSGNWVSALSAGIPPDPRTSREHQACVVSILISVLLAVGVATAAAEDLCPDVDKTPPTEGSRMTEDVFEVPAGLDAADKLQAYLNQEKIPYDFSQVVNAFVTKGVILRLQALAARTALDLAKTRQAAGSANTGDLDKAAAEAKKGLEAFCTFMVNAVVAE